VNSDLLRKKAYDFYKGGDTEGALACLSGAIALAPNDAALLDMRGMVLDALGRHEEALADFERALEVKPNFADAINNRGIHYARVGMFREALACYERALALAPDLIQAFYNRATTHLATGDWLRGFREFEVRWRLFPHEAARRNRLKPVWLGQWDVSGKTVLLHHEQGYGDTLQFVRYAALVMRLGARVIIAVPAALRILMANLPGNPQIVAEGDPIPEHDYCCSLMSLPHVFCTTPDSAPREVPYLTAESNAVQRWSTRLGRRTRARIGLVWSGRRYPPINVPRDMTLQSLRPVLDTQADFVCLQTDLSESERSLLAATPNVVRYGDVFEDFADTAGLIENLDLLITVDTAVAHLAGAMGKPVWIMNRYASCWRWLQKQPDSCWYPTLRLFRQSSYGDWSQVVAEVCTAAEWFAANSAPPSRSVALKAEGVGNLLNAALKAHHQAQLREAIAGYRLVLGVDNLQADALHFLGVALTQSGSHREALAPLSMALRLQPNNGAVHCHYGNVLASLARFDEALASYDQAISLDERLADAHYNRGITLSALGRLEQAVESFRRTLSLDSQHAAAYNNLGNAFGDLNRHVEALECYEQATGIRNDFVIAWVNRAHALRCLGRESEACTAARTALSCEPDNAEAHCALGAALAGLGQVEDALRSYQEALRLKPSLADAEWNKALAQLSQGAFREGWVGYEARHKVRRLKLTQRYSSDPPWRGSTSVHGKRILLHAEQGYGDSIQFCRYAPLLAERGAQVILGVPGGLRRVMTSLQGVATVVAQSPVPAFDYHCPLPSLPLALRTELATIPAAIPYLNADPALRSSWATRLGASRAVRVGLVWSGSPTHTNDRNRSIALAELLGLLRCEVEWVSVQKEVRSGDAPVLGDVPQLQRLGEDLSDFADTAALLAELDLLISVDTSVAHLAGALGKPVWILLPYVADWRWLRNRDDSPWYPTARLFRQPRIGDWSSVIDRVATELATFVLHSCDVSYRSYPPLALVSSG
jgi:tetratricopeptide (TPR) repeat protein